MKVWCAAVVSVAVLRFDPAVAQEMSETARTALQQEVDECRASPQQSIAFRMVRVPGRSASESTTSNQALHREVEQGRTIFPIRLDDTVLHMPSGWAAQLRSRNIGDFRGWKDHDHYQAAFTRLLRDLKAKEQGRA